MPAYGAAGSPVAISPGDFPYALFGTGTYPSFTGEAVAANSKSVSIARAQPQYEGPTPSTFHIIWASAPTAAVQIQGSNVDVDGAYELLYTSSNQQIDNYTDTTAWSFYRVLVSSYSAGGVLQVIVKR